jgi:AraC-like DNA-binding protein
MTVGNNLFFFFSALGAFNGLIIGIYFIFFPTKKNLSTYFLGALLLVLSVRIGKSVLYFFDHNVPKTLLQVGLTACSFIGPFLYFFVKTEIKQVRIMPESWWKQIVCWSILMLATGIFYPYESFPKLWTHYIIPLIYLQWGVYIVFSMVLVGPVLKKIARREKLKTFEQWILTICAAVTSTFLAYVWAFSGITKGSYISGPLIFSTVTYLVIFILLYRKKANDLSSFAGQKYGEKKMDEEEANLIIGKLKKVMTEKELFRNPDLKLNDLARAINVSGHQLSRVLNENMQKNFTFFVNEYRVNAACRMLLKGTNFTIDAIGEEVGFNSRSTFFAAFKKIKGLTPNAYQLQNTPNL